MSAASNKHDISGVSIERKIAFLSSPQAYGKNLEPVEVKETHMAWVFLIGNQVFKLKKPVKTEFLDFSTLAAREEDVRDEVRLNRRLAPAIYLGAVRLTLQPDGSLAIQGSGETVDWLVRMVRLPDEYLLDHAIRAGTVSKDQIVRLAATLAGFYRSQPPTAVSEQAYVDRFAHEHAVNHRILTSEQFDLDRQLLDEVLGWVDGVIEASPNLLMARVRTGHVLEGHGDLRPEHVCLSDPVVIIDCLEFSQALRTVDPFEELAYLAMECALLGAGWIGPLLIEHCSRELGEQAPQDLMLFHTAYRALLRARLCVAHLLEPSVRDPDKWVSLARAYLSLASQACSKRNQ